MTFNDIFKSSFLENVTSVSIFDMVLALLLAFGLGMFIFLVYQKTFSGVMYSSSFGVTLVALTTFFPIAVSLLEGYASTDRAAAGLLRSMGATRWQIFRHLEFPSALSHFFSGLRVSVSYAVVGAVISEWLGGFEGLGVYMTLVNNAYAFDKMFAVIMVIVAVSLLLMALVTLLRRRACPWEKFEKIERND